MDSPDSTYEVPDGITPLVGFRGWKVRDNGILTAAMNRDEVVWPIAGPLKAECIRPTYGRRGDPEARVMTPAAKHYTSPVADCTCGIHALNEFPKEWHAFEGVRKKTTKPWPEEAIVGMVKGWGHIIPGSKGWRAEFARPIALLTRPKSSKKWPPVIEMVAEIYGLEIVDLRDVRSTNGYRNRT